MGVRTFVAASLVLAWLGCAVTVLTVVIGPEGKGVTVDGAWAVIALALIGAALALLAVIIARRAPARRAVVMSVTALCLGGGSLPLLFALAER